MKTSPTLDELCGSDSGYQRHQRLGEIPCGPCRQARAAYQRDWRSRNPGRYNDEKRRQHARLRALYRLARLHHDEFTALYVEELG